MRALVGAVAGVIAAVVISSVVPFQEPFDQSLTPFPYLIALGIGIMFYFVSYGIARSIAKNVPKEKRRKIATEGIVPFMFLLLVFMIIVYTALHQSAILT